MTKKKQLDKLPKKLTARALLAIWTRKVKDRDGWACQLCGKTTGQMHAHHIRGRATNRLKFDLQNGITLCADHHKWHGVHSPDGGIAKEALDRLIQKIGPERWAYLADLKSDSRKLSLSEVEAQLNGGTK